MHTLSSPFSARLSTNSFLAILLHPLFSGLDCFCCSLPKYLSPAFPPPPRRVLPQLGKILQLSSSLCQQQKGDFSRYLPDSYPPPTSQYVVCFATVQHYRLTRSFCTTVTPPCLDLFLENSYFLCPILHTCSWLFLPKCSHPN